jgi:hydroxyethylthiazole kinase-like uncharacterized protein yjeF
MACNGTGALPSPRSLPRPLPQTVTALNGPWPLHDTAAARAAEQAALAAQPPQALMERAGLAAARLALALAPHGGRFDVWCGPGNNGGDGLVAARLLHQAGQEVQVALLAEPGHLPTDAAAAWRKAQAAGVPMAADMPGAASPPGLAIDALLGLGSRRAPAGRIAAAIAALNAGQAPVLAVDIPTGMHPDTGMPLGDAAVRATATLCLLTLKAGCFTGQGRDLAGAPWWDDLGVAAGPPQAWLLGRPAGSGARAHATHKGSFGDVAVVGGAMGMVGAAWLAARAASAAGAGRVYCAPLDPQASLLDPLHAELMGRRDWWLSPPAVLAATTVACGCGGGDAVRAALPPLLSKVRRLVLDADALNAIAADSALHTLLRARAGRGLGSLLTPHPLEAARLLATTVAEVQVDRLRAAHVLAQAFGVAVLLKGSGSVIAAPGHLPTINPSGNAALASAGTGDVLAGWAAGLWAQAPQAHAADIACTAAWQHGRAADLWPGACRGAPLRAGALVEALARRDFG